MTETSRSNTSRSGTGPGSSRRTIAGVLAGGGVLMAIMLLLAGVAVMLGWIRPDPGGRLGLRPWLALEIVVGTVASVLGGSVDRRIALGYRGPAILAVAIFSVGLLEATAILRYGTAVGVDASRWLVLLAPAAAAAGVLLGGWRPTTGAPHPRARALSG